MKKNLLIGIDLGGTNIAAGLVSESGEVLGKVSIPTSSERGSESIIEGLSEACEVLQKEAGFDRADLKAIGIGVPGMMDPDTGIVIFCPNIPIENVDLTARLKEQWGVPVFVNNDANQCCTCRGSRRSAKDTSNAICITLGTVVGGGIIIDNKIYSGFNGAAGEVGHLLVQLDGRQCGCAERAAGRHMLQPQGSLRLLVSTCRSTPRRLCGSLLK